MNEFILAELDFFLASFLWGVLLFFGYDLLVIIRKIIHHKGFFTALEDIGFWVTAGILIFRMMYSLNNGTIRYYAIISIILGMKLYQVLFGKIVVNAGSRIGLWIKKQIFRLLHFLAAPVRFLGRKIKKVWQFLIGIVRKRWMILKRFCINQLKKQVDKVKIKRKEKKLAEQEQEQEMEPIRVRGVLELVHVPVSEGDEYEKEKKKKRT